MTQNRWDVFVSYASEDREAVARPLAEELERCGLAVWYDQTQLRVGDSIRRAIDEGLIRARYGVVILSPSFFDKHYPEQELDGLAQREQDGAKVILPVWYNVAEKDVRQHSAWLAGRLAAKWEDGIAVVVEKLLDAITSEDDQQAAQWTTEARVHRIQSAGQLIDVFSETYGFSFHTDDPNADEVQSVAGLQQALQDLSDIWTQMNPAEQTRASVQLGDYLTQLHSMGWSVYGRLEQRRLAGMSEEGPIAVVAIVRGEPKAVLSLSDGLAVVRGKRRTNNGYELVRLGTGDTVYRYSDGPSRYGCPNCRNDAGEPNVLTVVPPEYGGGYECSRCSDRIGSTPSAPIIPDLGGLS
ncbi:MAG: toll/interleukin-1 receptor domain-containing protein [Gemmatimonadetes bacterium]|nr:toll/interleukin-1 receptor domain-containing protein [Gemmatimonadota bacterium]